MKPSSEYAVGAAVLVFSGLALMLFNGVSRDLGSIGFGLFGGGWALAWVSNREYRREKRVVETPPALVVSSQQPPRGAFR